MPARELTILMPCLNEAETIAACVGKALGFLKHSGIEGEVLVADSRPIGWFALSCFPWPGAFAPS
jgi:hypothetical protein